MATRGVVPAPAAAAAAAANGGGGGGAGYSGGGGGSGSSSGGGGGGGGGSSYCAPSINDCVTSTASGSPQVTLFYALGSAPLAAIITPANGATYSRGQVVDSSFVCSEGTGGSPISSCTDQHGHASGQPVDTSTLGSHTFTVTARSSDGLSSSSSVIYDVAAPPVIWLPLPAKGAVLTAEPGGRFVLPLRRRRRRTRAQLVRGPERTRVAVRRSTPRRSARTRSPSTATSADGQTGLDDLHVHNRSAAHRQPGQARHGVITFKVNLPAAGAIDALATASFTSFARAADTLQPALGTFVYGRGDIVAKHAETVPVTVTQSQAGSCCCATTGAPRFSC